MVRQVPMRWIFVGHRHEFGTKHVQSRPYVREASAQHLQAHHGWTEAVLILRYQVRTHRAGCARGVSLAATSSWPIRSNLSGLLADNDFVGTTRRQSRSSFGLRKNPTIAMYSVSARRGCDTLAALPGLTTTPAVSCRSALNTARSFFSKSS